MSTTSQITALGRAEASLFFRIKSNFLNVLFIPAMVLAVLVVSMTRFDLDALNLSLGPVMLASAAGVILVFSLYVPLTTTYVVRREERLLKRLRTGELSDLVILIGTALPTIVIAVVQFLLVAVIVVPLTGAGLPSAPHYPLIAVLLGALFAAALAAFSSAGARNSESVQVVILPGLVLLPTTSGAFFPLEAMPQAVQEVCYWMPFTPMVDLVRAGWLDTLSVAEALQRTGLLLGWTLLAVVAAQRWFRWESRV
ncbi:ABC transporter permease [Nocardiopsis synnemataformans]|uniref:ABC transporter permease n=1 Tax=Nocardiopsis synnemataformans TaxID=61305 RepID=UPI003EBA154D